MRVIDAVASSLKMCTECSSSARIPLLPSACATIIPDETLGSDLAEFLVTNWMVKVLTLCRPEEAHVGSLHCVRVPIGPPCSWIPVEIEVR